MRKKVLLVDDHPAMLWALKNMLAQQVHFEIIGEAVDGDGCLEFVRENDTDLIILDIDMPKVDGFDVIRRLKIISPDCRILVVSSLEAKVYGSRVRSLGGHGFINKTASSDIILAAWQFLKGIPSFISIILRKYSVVTIKSFHHFHQENSR